mmetsp:Transcript_16616/g.52114  ORF Transcript_16616/g.52114 Transcript_16616/m.52114 type:complete len:208 (-) Transcript_16616:349-972(-)
MGELAGRADGQRHLEVGGLRVADALVRGGARARSQLLQPSLEPVGGEGEGRGQADAEGDEGHRGRGADIRLLHKRVQPHALGAVRLHHPGQPARGGPRLLPDADGLGPDTAMAGARPRRRRGRGRRGRGAAVRRVALPGGPRPGRLRGPPVADQDRGGGADQAGPCRLREHGVAQHGRLLCIRCRPPRAQGAVAAEHSASSASVAPE